MTATNNARAGFTLAEVLAAMAFLAILTPVILQGLSLAGRAGARAAREAVALQLADNRLTEMIADESWMGGSLDGDFGEEWPGYRWSLEQTAAAVGDLIELTLYVDFEVQGRAHRVNLSTLAAEEDETS